MKVKLRYKRILSYIILMLCGWESMEVIETKNTELIIIWFIITGLVMTQHLINLIED